jgi:hypothetical protein
VFVEALVPQVWWIAEDTLEFWAVSLHWRVVRQFGQSVCWNKYT